MSSTGSGSVRRTGSATGSGSRGLRRAGDTQRTYAPSVCGFLLSGQLLALDVSLVGEVIQVEELVPVPRSRPELLGIFNLRGVPVAVLDLAAVLGLPPSANPGTSRNVLVLRAQGLLAGLAVEALDAVVPAHSAELVPGHDERRSPFVLGFLEVQGSKVPLTVLDAEALLARLRQLTYATAT